MDRSKTLENWDKQYLWHPFTQQYEWEKSPTLIIQSGQGVYFKDIKGRKYLDGVSSLWVNLHGHRHPVLDRAFRRQLSRIAHSTFLGLSHVPAIELGKKLASVAPQGLTRSFYSDNGATAVEVAIKMAFQYWIEKGNLKKPKRTEFLAVHGSYHGDTLGAVSVGAIGAFHSKFKPLLFKSHFGIRPSCYGCPFNKKQAKHMFRTGERVSKTPKPGDFRQETGCRWECLESVEKVLKKRSSKIAGAIVEPVMQGASGMRVQPPGYLSGFERLCRKYNVLLIADEVATGFGRTGTLFASEQEGIRPDFLCLAKALTAGYTPLAVTMTSEKIFRVFRAPAEKFKTFFHGHSYTAHPLGSAVAVANLDLIQKSKLLEKTRRKAHLLRDELQSFKALPMVASIRQAGLMVGIELAGENKQMGAAVCRSLLKKGVWLRPLGNVIVVMPPPVISESQLRQLVARLKTAILHEHS